MLDLLEIGVLTQQYLPTEPSMVAPDLHPSPEASTTTTSAVEHRPVPESGLTFTTSTLVHL